MKGEPTIVFNLSSLNNLLFFLGAQAPHFSTQEHHRNFTFIWLPGPFGPKLLLLFISDL